MRLALKIQIMSQNSIANERCLAEGLIAKSKVA
jgi:hypothetical protein